MIDKGLDDCLQINGKLKCLFDGWYLTSQVYSNEDLIEGIDMAITFLVYLQKHMISLFYIINRS